MRLAAASLWVAGATLAFAQPFHVYVGELSSDSVRLAWGSTIGGKGANTIGRDSKPLGAVQVRIAGRSLTVSDHNWTIITGLKPNTDYPYEVSFHGSAIGAGTVKTWEEKATKVCFFVIGDYGTGKDPQFKIANAMWDEFQRRASAGTPVRFVITTGDNIYGEKSPMGVRHSGAEDSDWESKFFSPYQTILAAVPFYPSLGNHDGYGSEARGDLPAYLDNFFFPGGKPARWYNFTYGGLADFFALDSTNVAAQGPTMPVYAPEGEESKWLMQTLQSSHSAWKIAYFHHPPYTAGPYHGASLKQLQHWVDAFQKARVDVVFNGHEHNFQYSQQNDKTGNILYVVTGAGGELRKGNVQSYLTRTLMQGWSAQNHFLVVEIDGRSMKITPLSYEPMHVTDASGKVIPMPIIVSLPQS